MKSHRILSHHLLIDFQYQSINCYQLILFGIDFDWLTNSSIAYAGARNYQFDTLYAIPRTQASYTVKMYLVVENTVKKQD